MHKRKVQKTLLIRLYPLVERAVEEGVASGWHRSFKHTDKPSYDDATDTITQAVMNSLCELFDFGDC